MKVQRWKEKDLRQRVESDRSMVLIVSERGWMMPLQVGEKKCYEATGAENPRAFRLAE